MKIQSNFVQNSYHQNFCKNNAKTKLISVERYPDYEARTYEIPASTGQKIGVGVASAIIPGLGQAINGQWGKGFGFFFGEILAPTLVAAPFAAKSIKNPAKMPIAALVAYFLTYGVIEIWNIVDAVKNAKKESVQIIPLNKNNTTVNTNA